LAIVSGYMPLPPIHTLGFHFCKWANVSAEMIIERNKNFTMYGFPVDVLWMDIEWADQYSDPAGYEYFIFNPQNFTTHQILKMNSEIEASKRRLTVIVDPHIKAISNYAVWEDGIVLEDEKQTSANWTNIFVRDPLTNQPFYGDCWPGNSSWIDFLNENA
jgi:alpha 1,3-glucosidase